MSFCSKKKKPVNSGPRAEKQILITQTVQFFLVFLFVFLLYEQEKIVLREITSNYAPWLIDQLKENLLGIKKIYQPAEFWRFLWPFLCVAIFMLLPQKIRWYFLGITGIISSVYLVANRIYDSFFTSVISVYSFKALPFLWSVKGSVAASLTIKESLFILSFLVFFIYGFIFNRFLYIKQNRKMILLNGLFAAIFILFSFQSWQVAFHYYVHPDMAAVRLKQQKEGVPFFEASDKGFACGFGLFNFLLMDVSRTIKTNVNTLKKSLTIEELQVISKELNIIKDINDRPSPFFGLAKDRNVILLSLESFSSAFVGLKAGETEIAPTVNRLKNEGFYWENVLSSISKGGSSDAEFSVLSGLMADRRKITVLEYPRRRTFIYLPEILKSKGYATLSLHGNNASFWARDINHPIFGIDTLFFKNKFSQDILQLGVSDRTFFSESADILLQQDQPFFAYLITLSGHHPYEVPGSHKGLPVGFPPGSPPAKLFQGVRYTDDALGMFMAKLEKSPLWEKSMIVIYGDHPVNTEHNDIIKQNLGIDLLSIREQRTPLIIIIPGKEAVIAEHRDNYSFIVSGLHDLFPTILHLLGIEAPYGIFGINQFVHNQQRVAFPWYIINNGYIKNGTIFIGSLGYALQDDKGVLFLDNDSIAVKPDERSKNYKQAQLYLKMHETMYDFDSQNLVRRIESKE
ncbi:LTA synthase family protein [Thermodesulfobacteriota bacterium]